MYKKFGIGGMFLLLVIILLVNPLVIYRIYNNILGRIVLICFIVFLTMNNVTLGLLAALCLIIASDMFFNIGSYNFIEGLDNMNTDKSGTTIGDDNKENSTINDTINIITKVGNKSNQDGSKISDLKAQYEEVQGVDRLSVDESIRSKNSKSLPVNDKSFSSDDVSASESINTKEGFNIYEISFF